MLATANNDANQMAMNGNSIEDKVQKKVEEM